MEHGPIDMHILISQVKNHAKRKNLQNSENSNSIFICKCTPEEYPPAMGFELFSVYCDIINTV